MKKILGLIIFSLFAYQGIFGQNVGISEDGSTAFEGAMLDIKSSNKGLLIPRMTSDEREAMTNLTEGLLVYDTKFSEFFYYSSGWKSIGSGSWQLGGNAGIDAFNFLGTTNNAALQFRTNNVNRFTINTSGDLLVANENQSIRFPAVNGSSMPMIQMFSSGVSNADRMVIAHSPSLPNLGIEYSDATDYFYLRNGTGRQFAFGLQSGNMGIGVENPSFPLEAVGRMRLRSSGNLNNAPGIWFNNQTNNFSRALLGMSKPDSGFGVFSQHMNKWAVEFELMREPRIGINTRATNDGVVRAELHVVHTNFGGSNDGVRIQNEGANEIFWNLYTSNSTSALEFFRQGLKRATIDGVSGAYTAVSDERLKQHMTDLANESILPRILQLKPSRYQMKPMIGEEGKMVASDKYHFGFSAQQVEPIFPELVFKGADAAIHDVYTMNYAGFGVLAIKAIQEQQTQIDLLKQELAELKAMLKKQMGISKNP